MDTSTQVSITFVLYGYSPYLDSGTHTSVNNVFVFSCDQAAIGMVQSICPSHLFDYVPVIVELWNFQDLLTVTAQTSMQ